MNISYNLLGCGLFFFGGFQFLQFIYILFSRHVSDLDSFILITTPRFDFLFIQFVFYFYFVCKLYK